MTVKPLTNAQQRTLHELKHRRWLIAEYDDGKVEFVRFTEKKLVRSSVHRATFLGLRARGLLAGGIRILGFEGLYYTYQPKRFRERR